MFTVKSAVDCWSTMVHATMYRVVILQPGSSQHARFCQFMNGHIAASMLARYKSTSQFGHPCTFVKTQVWMHLALLQKQLCNLCCHVRWKPQTWQHNSHDCISCVHVRLWESLIKTFSKIIPAGMGAYTVCCMHWKPQQWNVDWHMLHAIHSYSNLSQHVLMLKGTLTASMLLASRKKVQMTLGCTWFVQLM